MGLVVEDVERFVAFYRILFGQEPTKRRPGYAKFEVANPFVNLSLNEGDAAERTHDPYSHFGIQVQSSETLTRLASRFQEAGLLTKRKKRTDFWDGYTASWAKGWGSHPPAPSRESGANTSKTGSFDAATLSSTAGAT